MAMTFDPIFAKDPGNPNVVARNAVVTIFDPADPAKTPIAITDPTGSPLPNPITVDAQGMGPAFSHPTLARVGWTGGGYTNYFTSYEGLRDEAVAARTAAQAAASSAAADATVHLDELIAAGAFEGPAGPLTNLTIGTVEATPGNPLTDEIIASEITTPGTATATALSATYASKDAETSIASAVSLGTRGYPKKLRPVSKVVGYFGKAGHGWTANPSGSVNLNDTAIPMLGTQSITYAVGASATVRIDGISGTPYSVVNKYLRISFRWAGDISSILVYFSSDTSNTNRISKNILIDKVNGDQNTDITLDIPLSEFGASGTPDLANVVLCRIGVTAGPAGGTVSVGGVSLTASAVNNLPNGAVVISGDDSNGAQWLYMRPKLAEYGFAATLYPTFEALETGDGTSVYTVAQAIYMQDVHGFEFGSHALNWATHVDHVGQSEEWLREHFEAIIAKNKLYNFRGDSYAWPNTTSDALARRIAADYFRSGRGGLSGAIETHPPREPLNTRAINAGALSLASIKAAVDKAKAGQGVCRIFFHNLPVTKVTANDFARQDFYDLIDYIAAQGVPVYTESQIMNLPVT